MVVFAPLVFKEETVAVQVWKIVTGSQFVHTFQLKGVSLGLGSKRVRFVRDGRNFEKRQELSVDGQHLLHALFNIDGVDAVIFLPPESFSVELQIFAPLSRTTEAIKQTISELIGLPISIAY